MSCTRSALLFCALGMGGAGACSGAIGPDGRSGSSGSNGAGDSSGNPGGPGGDPGAGGSGQAGNGSTPAVDLGWPAFEPARAYQLRRLTNEQYLAAVQTLLGVGTDMMPPIERISAVAGFSAIGASTASVSAAGVGQFENAARFLAAAAFAPTGPRQKLVPCTPTGPADAACIKTFVTTFGQRVFRRPLTSDEITRYTTAGGQVATAANDIWAAFEALTSAFLQSPNFLYLAEVGAPDPANPGRFRFTDYEMASRLSFFLTNNTPDDMLLAAAAAGTLTTVPGVEREAARLLGLPSARAAVRAFFTNLLSLDSLDTLARPVELFPKFTATLGPAMKTETLTVLDDLVFGRDGDYRHLFDETETFVNPELAALYGLPKPAATGFSRATLPASSGRAGLLGQAGVLAARDHSDGTSPTKRGLFVLTRLLCLDLPLMPPANLKIPPPPSGILTARQRLEMHSTNPVCASCHEQTDPVGFSLEKFDAMGVYRDTDHGMPIDDTGKIGGVTYQGATGLGALLRDHPALPPCLLQGLYSVGVGHLATEFDRATFSALVDAFTADGARIKPLLTKLVSSEGFRTLPPPGN